MKATRRVVSLALSLLLVLICLAACGSAPTPDEIFAEISGASSAHVVAVLELKGMLSAAMVLDVDGAKSHIATETSMFGSPLVNDYYVEIKDGKRFSYVQESGLWVKRELAEEESGRMDSVAFFAALFSAEHYGQYDKETRRYAMKSDTVIELGGMECKNGYIELCEDGSYAVRCEIGQEVNGAVAAGTLELVFSRIGDVVVTIPEAEG